MLSLALMICYTAPSWRRREGLRQVMWREGTERSRNDEDDMFVAAAVWIAASRRVRLTGKQALDLLSRQREVALYVAINAVLILMVISTGPVDWRLLATLPAAYADGTLYDPGLVPFAWSPLFALLMIPLS